jgi:hypothetical protein
MKKAGDLRGEGFSKKPTLPFLFSFLHVFLLKPTPI